MRGRRNRGYAVRFSRHRPYYHQQHLAKNPDGYCGIGGYGVPFESAELREDQ